MSLIISFVFLMLIYQITDSPHGKEFEVSCDVCHSPEGWHLDREIYSFDHNTTALPLEGQHIEIDCKLCHPTLIFNEAENDCMYCHTDMHNQTVGFECARCHTPKSWIVENITQVHQLSRFPLLGPHAIADCYQCHPSASLLNFQPLGVECFDCHQQDYMATTNPNHVSGNFSTNCIDCHLMNAFSWTGPSFNHSFFPLTAGHTIYDCTECHMDGNDYSNISPECVSCHQTDYNSTTNPSHTAADLSTMCNDCHTTNPGWKPAEFREHDQLFFPVYTGKHGGEWDQCIDCHTNPANYSQFTCIDCHEHNQADMDDEHEGINGYMYNSMACLECHPTGDGEGGFNHNLTMFPLTGAHISATCVSCHEDGYAGTSTICVDCHLDNFNQSVNPNHVTSGIPDACEECHTTMPEWKPALFPNHNDYYQLTGAHATVANDCFSCHEGDYVNTPDICADCHMDDYNQTLNPNHNAIGISNVCEDCHTTLPEWKPALFPIHNDYYPLTGAHIPVANDCFTCHEGNYINTPGDCADCHMDNFNQTSNPNHNEIGISFLCESCHTTTPGWEPASFATHNDYYQLSGAHAAIASDCFTCHEGNYTNTPNTCVGCHLDDYNQTNDPPHASAQFPTECESCHSEIAWEPSTFNHDGQYFPIYTGEHQREWNSCSDCHTNPGNYAIFSCIDCHEHNQADMARKHTGVGGYVYNSNACLDCHPTGNGGKIFRKF